MEEEIRVIGKQKYKVVKKPCPCPCHTEGFLIMHVRACCQDGIVSKLERIKP